MSRFVRPVLLALVLILTLLALVASGWQWRRLQTRRAANAAILQGRALAPVSLGDAIRSGIPLDGRTVSVQGTFLSQGELLLRGRVQFENPGLHVVTPFRVAGTEQTLWVLRGFVASPDAVSRPAVIRPPLPGSVTISGLMLPMPETTDQGDALVLGSDTTWHRLDRGVVQARLPGSEALYLHLSGDRDGPGQLLTIPFPTLDDGPHLSYAIQWLGIAAAIMTFGYLMIWRRKSDAPRPTVPL